MRSNANNHHSRRHHRFTHHVDTLHTSSYDERRRLVTINDSSGYDGRYVCQPNIWNVENPSSGNLSKIIINKNQSKL